MPATSTTPYIRHLHGKRHHKAAVLVERPDGLYLAVGMVCGIPLSVRVSKDAVDDMLERYPRLVMCQALPEEAA